MACSRQRFAQRFEAVLQALADGLNRPRTSKRIDKLWQRIDGLKEQSHGAAQHYHIEIIPDASGQQAQAIRLARQPIDGSMQTHPGVYRRPTNEMTWDGMSLSAFIAHVSRLGIAVVERDADETAADIDMLDSWLASS